MTTSDDDFEIEFKSRHEPLTERMRQHATRKLQKLQRFNDRVRRIEVVADHAHEEPQVEILVHMRRGVPLVARERGDSFAATIDALVEKMEKQLKRQKEKRKDHKVPGARRTAVRARRSPERREETYEDVVRKRLEG
jgi:putative sigma-54 modulation protein